MRRGQTNPQRGLPRAPKWDRRELALLDAILDRSTDGQATARPRDLVEIAESTGRTVTAVATMLWKLRKKRHRGRGTGTPRQRQYDIGREAAKDGPVYSFSTPPVCA